MEIVKRLRQSVTRGYEPTDDLAIEAADEIERLRVALENILDEGLSPFEVRAIAAGAIGWDGPTIVHQTTRYVCETCQDNPYLCSTIPTRHCAKAAD
jgi:hypothetical protein